MKQNKSERTQIADEVSQIKVETILTSKKLVINHKVYATQKRE